MAALLVEGRQQLVGSFYKAADVCTNFGHAALDYPWTVVESISPNIHARFVIPFARTGV